MEFNFNVDKPLIIYKVNVEGKSGKRVDETISSVSASIQTNGEANVWVLPCNETNVECVWDPNHKSTNIEVDFQESINEILEHHSLTKEEKGKLKRIIRESKISKIINQN